MIGTYGEVLLYISLSASWYKPLGYTEKQGYVAKRRILSGILTESSAAKMLPLLGAKLVRRAILVPSLWERDGEVITEREMVMTTSSVPLWYVGYFAKEWAREIKKSYRRCSMETLRKVADIDGWQLHQDRIRMPSIWELPNAVGDRAWTKREAVDAVCFASSLSVPDVS